MFLKNYYIYLPRQVHSGKQKTQWGHFFFFNSWELFTGAYSFKRQFKETLFSLLCHNFLLMAPTFIDALNRFLQSYHEALWVRSCVWKKRSWSWRKAVSSCRLRWAAASAGASLTTAALLQTMPRKRSVCICESLHWLCYCAAYLLC